MGLKGALKFSQRQKKGGPKNHRSRYMDWKDNSFGNYRTLLPPVSWSMYQLPGLEWMTSSALFQEHSIDEVSHLSLSLSHFFYTELQTFLFPFNKMWIVFYSALLLLHLDHCLILNRYLMNIIWLKKWILKALWEG